MAGHNDSEKKSTESTNDLPTFNAENLQSNLKVIYYRFVFAILWAMKLFHLNYIFVEWRNVDKILICELDDLETYTVKIFNIYSHWS